MHRWLSGSLHRVLVFANLWECAKDIGWPTRRYAYSLREAWAELWNSRASLLMLRRHRRIHEGLSR